MAGKLGQPRADSLPRTASSGRQMFAEVHWSILGKGKGTPRPAVVADRRDKIKDDSDHFDIEEQLSKARTRCQAKLRVLSDLESGLSRLEEETRVLKKKMLRTSEEAKAVRVQYDADMTVIEALSDIRRSQCWRRPEPGVPAQAVQPLAARDHRAGRQTARWTMKTAARDPRPTRDCCRPEEPVQCPRVSRGKALRREAASRRPKAGRRAASEPQADVQGQFTTGVC